MMRLLIYIILFTSLLSCSGENVATTNNKKESKVLGIFGGKETNEYHLASPLTGVLLKAGEPLSNTKIIRKVTWNGNKEGNFEEFITDDKGVFSLPLLKKTLSIAIMAEFVSATKLYASTVDEDNVFWFHSRRDGKPYSDTGGEIESMSCDIDSEMEVIPLNDYGIMTKCQWPNMPAPL